MLVALAASLSKIIFVILLLLLAISRQVSPVAYSLSYLIALIPPRGVQVPAGLPAVLAAIAGIVGNVAGVAAMIQASYYG